jgi:hypothetical protein
MVRFRTIGRAILPLLAALVALLVAAPAWAMTTGTLKLVVTDDTEFEMPVPNATVTLTGASLIGGAQERSTDANGNASFSELLPGQYDIRVVKAGFAGVSVNGISIDVNRNTTQMVALPPEDAEEIVVEATRAAVDTESTSRGQILTKDFLERIPVGRSYHQATQLASGVIGTGNPSMGGSAYNENTYMLDGANITDPVTGTFSLNFNFDAIQQIEVLLGGYMPEYGVSIGGIINLVTESGTNTLEFDTSIYYENANWSPRMDARYAADGLTLAPTGFDSEAQVIQVGSKVSGPLVRDRAWFIISYQHERSIIANTGVPQTRDYDAHYVLTKLTVQPTSEHRLTAFLQLDPTVIDNTDQGDPYQKAEAQGRQAQGGFVTQGRWQWFLSPDVSVDTMLVMQKTYIEVNAVPCTHNRELDYHPCKPDEQENDVDWETPGRYGSFGAFDSVNYGYYYFDDRFRYNASSKLSILSVEDPLGGTHDFKFGMEGVQLVWDQIQGYAGNMYQVDLNVVPYDPNTFENFYNIEISGPIKFRITGSQWNFFAQDSWKPVSNLTLNYGTRFDNFVMRNDLGEPVLNGALFGPRMFGAWDPWGDQKTKVATGYGRFNDTGRLAVSDFTSAGTYGSKLFLGEYFGDAEGQGFVSSTNVAYDYNPSKNYNVTADNLRTPRVDEVILLLEREVLEDVALFSDMSGKFTRNIYEPDELNIIYDSDGSAVIGSRLSLPQDPRFRLRTPALAKRDYFQWDLGVRKVESRRWGAYGAYTYARSIGTSNSSLSGSFLNDPQSQYNYGPLFTGRQHQVKAYGFWDLPTDPWTQQVSFFLQYYSGFEDERLYLAEDITGSNYRLRIKPRGSYYTFNPFWRLDLRFQQSFDVRKGKFKADIAVENVTNNRAPEYPEFFYIDAENRLLAQSRQDSMRLVGGLKYEF